MLVACTRLQRIPAALQRYLENVLDCLNVVFLVRLFSESKLFQIQSCLKHKQQVFGSVWSKRIYSLKLFAYTA